MTLKFALVKGILNKILKTLTHLWNFMKPNQTNSTTHPLLIKK